MAAIARSAENLAAPTCRSLHPLCVAKILVSSCRALVAEERVAPDEVDVQVAERRAEALGPRLVEGDAGQFSQDIDASGRETNLVDDPELRTVAFRNLL